MPAFPLTGVFVPSENCGNYPTFDNALVRCDGCGHVQLRDAVDPTYLYQDTYTHRSSLSPIATRGNDSFYDFFKDVAGDRLFECIVDIGCNDLYLLGKFESQAGELVGFDPIFKDDPHSGSGRIQAVGKYVEEIDAKVDIPAPPDLVISVHTMEHVIDPLESLRPIYAAARPGALFMLEVPGFDSLLNTFRFDQVFLQHLNYFSLGSFQAMFRALGAEYVAHRFNYHYWQGTLMVAFRKPSGAAQPFDAMPAPSSIFIQQQYRQFKQLMIGWELAMEQMARRGTPLYGFGAAQMVPTLAYHLPSHLGHLQAVRDDNCSKDGLSWPGFPLSIEAPSNIKELKDAAVVVTAIDSARILIRKLSEERVRHILFPYPIL